MTDVVAVLQALFDGEGGADYLGEEVTLAGHMLQTGGLALASGAPDHLVVAALLHDIGHLTGPGSGAAPPAGGQDRHHETGADWLSRWFPAAVTEPVRAHVAAKRYLCAVDPDYRHALSPASTHSLVLQGGPMTDVEIVEFESSAHRDSAVAVRYWDDQAKDPTAPPRPFAAFAAAIRGVATPV